MSYVSRNLHCAKPRSEAFTLFSFDQLLYANREGKPHLFFHTSDAMSTSA